MKQIKDSGNRTEFESGAVRDLQEGKGRCDLLPLDVVSTIYQDSDCIRDTFQFLNNFQELGDPIELYNVLISWLFLNDISNSDMLLEVAKHFEEGAKKYGERNWEKGIPVRCYIDSAIRHYLKWLRGDEDEPHDRAFCWNILCAIWTCKHFPNLNEYAKEKENE